MFTVNPTDDSSQQQIIHKQERDLDDEDMEDDTITEPAHSPQVPPSPPLSTSNPASPSSSQLPDNFQNTELLQNEPNTDQTNSNQTEIQATTHAEKNGLLHQEDGNSMRASEIVSEKPSRINNRRFTSVVSENDAIIKQNRKRRLSVVERSNVDSSSSVYSHSIENSETITTKRRRVNESSETNPPTAKSNDDTKSKDVPSIPFSPSVSIKIPQLHVATPPQKKKSQSQKKCKNNVRTPLITKFLKSSPRCDKCSKILNSRNELNFHMKSHTMKKCVKCRKQIDNENPASIQSHVISCLLLDNKIQTEQLTHFLKVKVDLNRLTPTSIAEIQENLEKSHKSKKQKDKTEKSTTIISSEMDTIHVDEAINVMGSNSHISNDIQAAEQSTTSNDESNDGKI